MTPAAKVYDLQEEKNVAAGQSRVSKLRRRNVEEVRFYQSPILASYIGNAFPVPLCLVWFVAALDALADSS